jgi:hypothetical protein
MTVQHSGRQIRPPVGREVSPPDCEHDAESAEIGHGPVEPEQSRGSDTHPAAAAWPLVAIGFGLVAVLAWILFLGWLLGHALLAAF